MLSGEVPFKGSSIPSIMKKHLTLPPPSFHSKGVAVPPPIEAVVRHALEKEVGARIDSIPSFLRDLHAALNSAPVAAGLRETVVMDPNKTVASMPPPPTSKPPDFSATSAQPPIANETNVGLALDSLGSGTGAPLDKDVQKSAPAVRATVPLHAEEDRLRKEDRERREKEQQEKFERMAAQAKELEDRLDRLSGSMPPGPIDPETTRVQGAATSPDVAARSYAPQPGGPAKMIVDFAPKRKAPPLLLIGVAVMILVLAGVGVGAYLMLRQRTITDDPRPTPSPTPSPQSTPDLLVITGGSFTMGCTTGPFQETPPHIVTVQKFMMDRTEVSNTEYAEFINDSNHAVPNHWAGKTPPFGQERWPVVNVSLEDANAFAAWRSKRDGVSYRLPTDEEWEYAARNGERSDRYPWGPEWKANFAVLKEISPAPVGSRPEGKNRWGVVDLIGNVWELTSSRASVYPGSSAIIRPEGQAWLVIRGGGFVSDPTQSNHPVSSCMREFVPPGTKTTQLGFRLARNEP